MRCSSLSLSSAERASRAGFLWRPPLRGPTEIVYQAKKRGLSGKDRKHIARAVEEHRDELYAEWLEKALVRDPGEQT